MLVADTREETEETSTTHATAASKKGRRRIKRIIQNIHGPAHDNKAYHKPHRAKKVSIKDTGV